MLKVVASVLKLVASAALLSSVVHGHRSHATPTPRFGNPVPVTIKGYHGSAMEPFLSPTGDYLFFNNLNQPGADTNLLYATRIDKTTFAYQGEIAGVNSPALDAVPTMDAAHNFYFVSTRSYSRTLSTIYHGIFDNGAVSGISRVHGISRHTPGMVNFDVDVSPDGATLYFNDGQFTRGGQLSRAELVIAAKTSTGFQRLSTSAQLLANVNSATSLNYAATISKNGLDLYFTRAPGPLGSGLPSIYVATRPSSSSAFGVPTRLALLTGFVEAPALSANGHGLYFHERVGNTYQIYYASRLPP